MSQQEVATRSSEERLLAALSHAAIVIQGLGMLVGVVVYATQRDKSRYAALQGLQAAVYQLAAMFVMIALWLCWGLCYFASFVPMMAEPSAYHDAPPPFFFISMGSMVIPFGLMLLLWLYGLWGAVRAWQGADFRYAIIGPWLERSGLWNGEPK